MRESKFMSTRQNRICKIFGAKLDYNFAIKCLFKQSPILITSVIFTISVLILSFLLKIAEG
jgi:hypothetical protein